MPTPPPSSPEPDRPPRARSTWVRDLLEILLVAVVLYGIIWTCIETVRVDGDSMQNTLQNGDFLIASKISYFFGSPARGDIVILEPPHMCDATSADYIKRVMGLPGDNIEIDTHTNPAELLVQPGGTGPWDRVEEPYLPDVWEQPPAFPTVGTADAVDQVLHIPAGDYFVMGDNRNESCDSPLLRAGLPQPHPGQGDPPGLAAEQLRRPGAGAHPGGDRGARRGARRRPRGPRPGGAPDRAPPPRRPRAVAAQPGRPSRALTAAPTARRRLIRPASTRRRRSPS